MNYRIENIIKTPSQPVPGGFSKQVTVYAVISPNGKSVRTYGKRWMAENDLRLREARAEELKAASAEAKQSGTPVEVKGRGRARVTIYVDPSCIKPKKKRTAPKTGSVKPKNPRRVNFLDPSPKQ